MQTPANWPLLLPLGLLVTPSDADDVTELVWIGSADDVEEFKYAAVTKSNMTSPLLASVVAREENTTVAVVDELATEIRWHALWLILIVVGTAIGNILLCLAVITERRLQNMTNYFLTSLAVADLLVALLVMPLALVVELFGE